MDKQPGVADGWLNRRVMTLTPFERRCMNSPGHARDTRRTALALFEHIELPRRPVCLEIGCGQGALARLLVERFDARVIATDYDPRQVAVARERLADLEGKVELRVVDARDMPFDGSEFDAVFSFGILHHILHGWRRAVAEVARVLRPGGWFIFTEIVAVRRVEHLLARVLPSLDLLGETTLHTCLASNGLHLEHWAPGGGGFMSWISPMAYCTAVARLNPSYHHKSETN